MKKLLARLIVKLVKPYMVAGILLHEKESWLTIRVRNGGQFCKISLADLRNGSSITPAIFSDGKETLIEVEYETKDVHVANCRG